MLNLAGLLRAQGRYGEAEPFYKRALAIFEKFLGSNHPSVATSLNNLATLYSVQGRDIEAESLRKRALAIREKTFGPNHPSVAKSLSHLALLYRNQGHNDLALDHIRRASVIYRDRVTHVISHRTKGVLSEQRDVREVFLAHILATITWATNDPPGHLSLSAEGFEAGQLASSTSAGAAVSRMAARFATGDDALAGLVRDRQDAAARWRTIDAALTKAASLPPGKRNQTKEATLRRRLAATNSKITAIDGRLANSFPQFAELSSPKPIPLTEVQGLLTSDEALLTYLVWSGRTFLFVVRRDRVAVKQISLGTRALAAAVAVLRKALVPAAGSLLSFDTTTAYKLYQKLFQPAEELLAGARHIFVVPDGAMQSLPLAVLVTQKPTRPTTRGQNYRQMAWLAKKYAMTTLPSVSSLRALRKIAKRAKASKPFLGVGDPILEGGEGALRGVSIKKLFQPIGLADAPTVRALPRLPETRDELTALARILGAKRNAMLLGGEATERAIKAMSLKDYRVLAFATHALVAGELAGLSEPALVLTPPKKGTKHDDGLLTASEVAQLKLDANWVILSACNTASSDGTPGAEGLSGLAKAFFYAGSRALLVSHWPVASEAITTRMLVEARKPDVGRAEALRRAMLALMQDEERPEFAHPYFWAPFVVVGEGGRGR